MNAVLLFWDSNMAEVTSCKKRLVNGLKGGGGRGGSFEIMSDFISPCCSPLICSPPLVAAVGASFFMCGFPLLNTASNCLSI